MSAVLIKPKPIVAVIAAIVMFSLPVQAQQADANGMEALLERLQHADPAEAQRIDRQIKMEWDKSGSAAMDLLLRRGRDAMERGDFDLAIEHLTALTDHAPDFAEGWHQRASAWFQMDRYGLAMADLEQALTLNPNHYEALFGLAVVLEQLEKLELAYRAYELVLQIDPHYDEAADALKRLETQVQGRAL